MARRKNPEKQVFELVSIAASTLDEGLRQRLLREAMEACRAADTPRLPGRPRKQGWLRNDAPMMVRMLPLVLAGMTPRAAAGKLRASGEIKVSERSIDTLAVRFAECPLTVEAWRVALLNANASSETIKGALAALRAAGASRGPPTG